MHTFARAFKKQWLATSMIIFRRSVGEGLKAIVDADWNPDAVKDYSTMMSAKVGQLVGVGHKRIQTISCKVMYMGALCHSVFEGLNDEWTARLRNLREMCAVNSGKVEMLPYELLAYAPGEVLGVPVFSSITAKEVKISRQ